MPGVGGPFLMAAHVRTVNVPEADRRGLSRRGRGRGAPGRGASVRKPFGKPPGGFGADARHLWPSVRQPTDATVKSRKRNLVLSPRTPTRPAEYRGGVPPAPLSTAVIRVVLPDRRLNLTPAAVS